MADVRIYSTEEAVGYGHPSKTDVMNRFQMVSHDSSGHHSTADFCAVGFHKNSSIQELTTGSTQITFSSSVNFYNQGFTINATGFLCPSTGVYFFNGVVRYTFSVAGPQAYITLSRNGSNYFQGPYYRAVSSAHNAAIIRGVFICASTTDIFTVLTYHDLGTASLSGDSDETHFEVCKIGA